MIKIKRIYEFLELDKSYDYIETERSVGYNDEFKEFLFKADDQETYIVILHINTYQTDKMIKITWCNEKDKGTLGKIDEKTDKNANINTVFKIINTVFKIVFNVMKKENIDIAEIGSRNKSKFRVYKQAIEKEKNFKIIDEWIQGKSYPTYYIKFKYEI